MKIIHFENKFFPKTGYQVNILAKLQARMGHDVTIISSENRGDISNFKYEDINEEADKEYTNTTGVKIIRLPYKKEISQRIIYKDNIIEVVNKLHADILFAHGNDSLSGMIFTWKYKKLNCPVVFDSHMLDMATKNKFHTIFRKMYKKIFTKIIIKNQFKVIRTQDDDYVMKWLGIPGELAPFISYGSDLTLFHRDENVRNKFRINNGIGKDDFVVIYAGRLNCAKGGQLLADAFKYKFDTKKNIVLVVVGNYYGEYGEKVKETFLQSENKVIMFPTQSYIDLPKFYQCADLAVFPRQCSLSFYDVQACGLPVLSEDNNVNMDRCSHDNGSNFKSGDVSDFRKRLEEYFNMSEEQLRLISSNAEEFIRINYNYEDVTRRYNEVLISEYNRQKLKKK